MTIAFLHSEKSILYLGVIPEKASTRLQSIGTDWKVERKGFQSNSPAPTAATTAKIQQTEPEAFWFDERWNHHNSVDRWED